MNGHTKGGNFCPPKILVFSGQGLTLVYAEISVTKKSSIYGDQLINENYLCSGQKARFVHHPGLGHNHSIG